MVWKSLPNDRKNANSFQSFKMKLKAMLTEQLKIFVFNCLLSFLRFSYFK